MLRAVVAAALAGLAAPAAAQALDPVDLPCERACMERLADRFLAALAARDATVLPLAPGARHTENGQAMGFDTACGGPRAWSAPIAMSLPIRRAANSVYSRR